MAQEVRISVALEYEVEAAKYTPTSWVAFWPKGTPPPRPTHFTVKPILAGGRASMKRVDAWKVRSEFLSIPTGNNLKLCNFFNRRGFWSDAHKGLISQEKPASGRWCEATKVEVDADPHWMESMVEIEEIWGEQQELKKALLEGPEAWFTERKKMLTFQTTAWWPHLLQTDRCLKDAIYTAVTLDFLRGSHFKACARQDCGTPFLFDHKAKQFCSQYCGHLESLRRLRASAKAAKDVDKGKSSKTKKPRTEKTNVHLQKR
jgi:hypothetical protein